MTTDTPTVVWTEIPVTDLSAASAFYGKVFDWKMTEIDMGPNKGVNFNDSEAGVSGHLYPGNPARQNGPTIHLAVPGKLEDAMTRCWEAGGTVHEQVIEIPPGRFAYATDPDGNSIGLFEPKAA